METSWRNCKNILVIRPNNMGDIIMMTPALHSIKAALKCRITLLTSTMGSLITPYIKNIDDTIIFDAPWVKTNNSSHEKECAALVEQLQMLNFDGAIISTVYSQNPLPSALIAFMAGIPLRLSYCRENPYELLTDWIPDKEPYSFIRHQVQREIDLVKHIGIETYDDNLSLDYNESAFNTAIEKINLNHFDAGKNWIIIHPGVSEPKREYPLSSWIKICKTFHERTGYKVLITGSAKEKHLAEAIQNACSSFALSIAGLINMEEFIALIANSPLVISVNTVTTHIAAATKTPVVVLYAQSNPQHTPWKVPSVVLPFSVTKEHQSKNEVIQFVNEKYYQQITGYPSPLVVVDSAIELLSAALLQRKESNLTAVNS